MKSPARHLASLVLLASLAPRTPGADVAHAVVYRASLIYTGDARETAVRDGALYVKGDLVVAVLKAGEPAAAGGGGGGSRQRRDHPGAGAAGGVLVSEAAGAETAGAQYRALDAFNAYDDQRLAARRHHHRLPRPGPAPSDRRRGSGGEARGRHARAARPARSGRPAHLRQRMRRSTRPTSSSATAAAVRRQPDHFRARSGRRRGLECSSS
ncbi:MAG: hypothetical protein U1E76_07250 [Planctomycetota bacterium]